MRGFSAGEPSLMSFSFAGRPSAAAARDRTCTSLLDRSSQAVVVDGALLLEAGETLRHLPRRGMDRQPLPGHPDRRAPGEVLPEVELDLRGADDLGHLLEQALA